MSQITKLGSGITPGTYIEQIDGDVGFVSGAIIQFSAVNSAGSSVSFDGSGTLMQLDTTDSFHNTLVGGLAGNATLTGDSNTGFGFGILNSLTSGRNNVGIGFESLVALQTGNSNTAVGYESLAQNNGSDNTAVGVIALGGNPTGVRNCALGSGALVSCTGNRNIGIGYSAGGSFASGDNNIYIGTIAPPTTTESDATRIGNTGLTATCYILGIGGVDVASTANVVVEDGDQLGTAVLTAGTGISITAGPNSITIDATGGGGGVGTIDGDSGSATGSTITFNAATNSGSTVEFTASGSTVDLHVTDLNDNTIVGLQAGNNAISGINNTGLGSESLMGLTSGSNNVAVGYESGKTITSGSNNIYLGNIDGAAITESNTTRIGHPGDTADCFILGIGGVDVGSTANVVVENNDQLGTAVLSAGSGISISTGANSITIAATGGGGGITTVDGDTGSITGSTVSIKGNGATNAGSSVSFSGSGTAMTFNTTDGGSNTLIGMGSGASNTGSSNNCVALGKDTLGGMINGTYHVAIGQSALLAQTDAFGCTAIGYAPLFQLNGGSYNTALGYLCGSNYTGSESSNICIGASTSGTVGESNVLRIGSATGTGTGNINASYICGIAGTNVGSVATVVTESGDQLGTAVLTAGAGITITPTANIITITATGGGGGGIVTIDGDSGSITGSTVTLAATSGGTAYAGSSVTFDSLLSGVVMVLAVTDNAGNTFIGQDAGTTAITAVGGANSGFGAGALAAQTSGNNNTVVGAAGLASFTGGNGNVGVGFEVAIGLLTGSENTIIGDLAGTGYSGAESSNILIGSNVLGNAGNSNELYIGAGTGTGTGQINSAFISGIQGITVVGSAVLVSSSDQLGVAVSSRRYKENVQNMGDISSDIFKLRPVSFNYIVGNDQSLQTGLIAEEVEEIMPSLCTYDKDGVIQSVKYHDLPALLLNEIQKLRKEVDYLKTRIKE